MSKQTESSPFRFAEIAKEAGIDFVHFSGMTEEKHFPTANGSGVAVFDYDNDGLLDIYFATATLLPLGTAEKGPNRLFKNLGNDRFKDVTEKSGLGYRGFCHGIIAGDIDNDGDVRRVPVQLRQQRPVPQQRRRDLQGHQQVGRDRRAQLVLRRRDARLRQRRVPGHLRDQLRHLELSRRPPPGGRRGRRRSGSIPRPARSRRPGTCSTTTTATGRSRTSTIR